MDYSDFQENLAIARPSLDRRYSQPSALRAIVSLPFNHGGGVNAEADDPTTYMDLTHGQIMRLEEATDHLVLEFDNFNTTSSAGESPATPGSPNTGYKFDIEATVWIRSVTGSSVFYGPFRVTFLGGQTTYTLHPRTRIRSDVLYIGQVPERTEIRVMTHTEIEDEGNLPVGRLTSWGSQGYVVGDATETAQPSFTAYAGYGPCAVYRYGDLASGMALMGDSRIYGTGETSGIAGGWAARRCYELGIGTTFGAKSGEKLSDWLAGYSHRQNRLALCGDVPRTLLGYGINDFTAGSTYSDFVSNLAQAIDEIYQLGGKVYVPTIYPYTQSSDSFATATNQTRNASFSAQAESYRQQFNAALRDGSLVETLGAGYAGYFDVAALVEVNSSNVLTLNGGLILATGSTGTAAMTTDGLHLNTLGNTTVMPAISDSEGAAIRRGTPTPRISTLVG